MRICIAEHIKISEHTLLVAMAQIYNGWWRQSKPPVAVEGSFPRPSRQTDTHTHTHTPSSSPPPAHTHNVTHQHPHVHMHAPSSSNAATAETSEENCTDLLMAKLMFQWAQKIYGINELAQVSGRVGEWVGGWVGGWGLSLTQLCIYT